MADPHVIERPQRWDLPFSRDLAVDEEGPDMSEEDLDRLLSVEPFRVMAAEKFPPTMSLRGILKNDARLRRYGNGDVIVRQGDYGHSAFLILDGQVRAILQGLSPVAIGRRERKRNSWIRSLAKLVTNPKSPEARDTRQYPQMRGDAEKKGRVGPVLAQDVTNVLSVAPDAFEKTSNRVMERGEFFGELAALGRIPRSVTVVSDGDSELLEIRWQGLRDLRKYDATLRQRIDEQYRTLGLVDTLQGSPLLTGLNPSQLQKITEVAEFETYGQFDWYGSYQQMRKKEDFDPLLQEPVIANEGDYPNGLILIRAGFARLSRKYGNGEQTFSYLGKGDVYGLAELAHNARNPEPVSLNATLRAVGYVDVVRIPTRTFEDVILPNLPPDKVARSLSTRGKEWPPGASVPAAAPAAAQIDTNTMEFLVENRFLNGTATMLIDLDRCVRCDECVRACATGHDNNPRFIRHGKVIGHHMVANACMHCVDPVCMIGCPTGAIHRDEEGGEVVINDLTCIGCGTCAASCPYDNIRMVDVRDRWADDAIMIEPEKGRPISKATKCDLCVDHYGGPACERACPHDALVRVDMRDLNFLGRWLNR